MSHRFTGYWGQGQERYPVIFFSLLFCYFKPLSAYKMPSEAFVGQSADMYGQVHPHETEDLISSKLAEFDVALAALPSEKNPELILAQQRCPQLLTADFKLCFLRCEVFHVERAAKRFAKYWERRVSIFGPDRAFEPITADKIMEQDGKALHNKFFQIVDAVDHERSLLFVDPSQQESSEYTRESMVRAIWFKVHNMLARDDICQRKGLILIVYPYHAESNQFDPLLVKQLVLSFVGSLPVRISAFHVCHPDAMFRVAYNFMKMFIRDRLKQRVHVHVGSQEVVLDTLEQNYGFTRRNLPMELGGEYKCGLAGLMQAGF